MIALTPFAHVALGQSVINGGVSTQTVVNPSVLPDSLPIGSEQAVMDWVVTNRQWYGNARPLSAFTVISVRYTGTNKIQGARSFGLTDYEFTSYKDFEFCIGKFGMELVEKIKSDPRVDHSIPLSMYAYHAYTDVNAETGPMGIYLSKDLGLARDVSQDSFLDFKIFSQVVVRIPNLEKFEVEVDGDKPYHFFLHHPKEFLVMFYTLLLLPLFFLLHSIPIVLILMENVILPYLPKQVLVQHYYKHLP
jgi:hypothetical protein